MVRHKEINPGLDSSPPICSTIGSDCRSLIAVPVLVFHARRAAALCENRLTQYCSNVSRTRNSKCLPTLSIVCEKQVTSSNCGKKNLTCLPSSQMPRPSLQLTKHRAASHTPQSKLESSTGLALHLLRFLLTLVI